MEEQPQEIPASVDRNGILSVLTPEALAALYKVR